MLEKFQKERGKRLILLLPLRVDYIVLAVQERAAESKKLMLKQFTQFSGVYRIKNGKLILQVTGGNLTSGRQVPLDVDVTLGKVS